MNPLLLIGIVIGILIFWLLNMKGFIHHGSTLGNLEFVDSALHYIGNDKLPKPNTLTPKPFKAFIPVLGAISDGLLEKAPANKIMLTTCHVGILTGSQTMG